ncbi:hypothetical protein QJ48_16580 [Paenibacillus sp. A3]|uniref:hypothetical protein n=1 Tax=Paenibacillus sp. A3 TaxID=1337054 RepID=UPI0006D5334D|nr:hypothetical protein [Paenibacillus sp. A3]KPV58385.1 hypothetical protein QJ48_16580 [Paenibacillus sp. A3]
MTALLFMHRDMLRPEFHWSIRARGANRTTKKEFKDALLDARDRFGKLMATAWSNTSKEDLLYGKVLQDILNADRQLYNGKYERTIRSCFDWREITTNTAIEAPRFETHLVDELVMV